MGKKGNNAPAPIAPDPVATARAQGAENIKAAQEQVRLNTYNQYGPSGSVTYTRDANGLPIAQHTNLTQQGQQIFDQTQNMQLGLMDRANQALDNVNNEAFTTSGMPYDPRNVDTSQMSQLNLDGRIFQPNSYGDLKDYTSGVGNAIMENQMMRIQPQFDQRRAQVANDLQQRGIPVGSEAYNTVMGNLEREQNQAITGAANNATISAGNEASRIFGMEQSLADKDWSQRFQVNDALNKDFANKYNLEQSIRGNAIQDELLDRNQNFNEAQAFFTGSGPLATPQATQRAQASIAAPDLAGLTMAKYSADNQAYQQAQQQKNALWGGVGQLAGTALMWSSKAMKHDLGDANAFLRQLDKLKIHTWQYRDETGLDSDVHIGPFAEEWAKLFGGNGQQIHIGDMVGVALQCIKELREENRAIKYRLDRIDEASNERQLELL